MNPEIEILIKLTVATGEITEKKRAIIMKKAESLGENLDEVELILNGELALSKRKPSNTHKIQSSNIRANKKADDINFVHVIAAFINNYKIVKYSLIFFLCCLAFFLLTVLIF